MAILLDSETNDITMYCGESDVLQIDFFSDEARTIPLDITGQTLRLTVKKTVDTDPTDSKAIILIDEVQTAPNPTNRGTITITSSGELTGSNQLPGVYAYDIKQHVGVNNDNVVIRANFNLKQGVGNR